MNTIREFNTFIDSRWLTLELATIAVAAGIFIAHRTPYILFPITLVFFWMVMDYSMYQAEAAEKVEASRRYHQIYEWNSVYFGLAAMAIAGLVDWFKTTRVDMPYWIYTAGVISFWGGLIAMGDSGDWAAFKFFLVNCVLFIVGGVLSRGIFTAAGAFGIGMYVYRLVEKTYRDDPYFPLYIAGIGAFLVITVWLTRPLHGPAKELLRGLAPERLRKHSQA